VKGLWRERATPRRRVEKIHGMRIFSSTWPRTNVMRKTMPKKMKIFIVGYFCVYYLV